MAPVDGCRICSLQADLDALPLRERIHLDEHWRVSHGWSSLEGWLVVCSRSHVQGLDELEPAALVSLSPLLAAGAGALKELLGCEWSYVMSYGELPQFHHLHLHVVPRMAWFTEADAGVNVFRFLRPGESEMVSPGRRDELAEQLRAGIGARL